MLYKARVLDTSKFPETGRIRVKVYKDNEKHFDDELSKNPSVITNDVEPVMLDNAKILHHNQEAYVTSIFGGGTDYGAFYLPRVNSIGIVSTLGNTKNVNCSNKYVWLGGLYTFDPEDESINIPNGTMDNKNGIVGGTYADSDLNDFIIKTRNTYLLDPLNPETSKETMNWEERPIENLFVMGKNKVQMSHNVFNEETNKNDDIIGSESINFGRNGISIIRKIDNTKSEFSINNDGTFSIYRTGIVKDKTRRVYINNTSDLGIEIGVDDGDKNQASIGIESDKITIATGKVTLEIEEDTVKINASGAIQLNSDAIRLGDGEHPIVMADLDPNGLPKAVPEGMLLSNKLYG